MIQGGLNEYQGNPADPLHSRLIFIVAPASFFRKSLIVATSDTCVVVGDIDKMTSSSTGRISRLKKICVAPAIMLPVHLSDEFCHIRKVSGGIECPAEIRSN